MRTFFIFCATFAVVLSFPCDTEHLQFSSCKTNLYEFMYMIRTYDLMQLYRNYANNNEQNVINAFAYFKSLEFKNALEIVVNLESMKPFRIDASYDNVSIEELLDELSERFGSEIWLEKQFLENVTRGDKSFHDFLEDAKVFVQTGDINFLSYFKFHSVGLYNRWYCQYKNMDKEQFINEAMEQEIVQSMLKELVKLNVDVTELLQHVKSYFVDDDFEC